MRIVKLQAENIKRLKAVEITPEGDLIVIAGKNGQGKTSVLDAIWYALGGGAAQKGVSKPIRDGESGASVTVDLGSIKVTRNWTEDKTALRVESADGARYSSPQSMLDDLVGKLSFDPLEFINQSPKEQVNTLLEVAPIGIDLEEIDRARRENYERRTEVNREARKIEGALSELPPFDNEAGTESVDIGALYQELDEIKGRAHDWERLQEEICRVSQGVEELERNLVEAKANLSVLRDDQVNFGLVPEPTSVQEKINNADRINKAVENNKRRTALAEELNDRKETSDSLSAAIISYDNAKEKAISEAKMPVPGLGFDEDGITLNGVPFSQASSAEQLKVSVAIAMALNPKIRIIRITDGSLLDSDNLKLIEDMARDNDFQCWIERVDESGNVGVVIEDGSVKQ